MGGWGGNFRLRKRSLNLLFHFPIFDKRKCRSSAGGAALPHSGPAAARGHKKPPGRRFAAGAIRSVNFVGIIRLNPIRRENEAISCRTLPIGLSAARSGRSWRRHWDRHDRDKWHGA